MKDIATEKPICIDLFCGLGGWTEAFLSEGYVCIGFDNGSCGRELLKQYLGYLVLQDVISLDGSQFKNAAVIVASPPCQEYSYMAMPWSRAKTIAQEYRDGKRDVQKLTALFDACFRIQREASEAAGHKIPLIVENVKGAQKWVGRANWLYGSFALWGDVPALMPIAFNAQKMPKDHDTFRKMGEPCQHFTNPSEGSGYKKNNNGYKNARNWWSGGKGSLSAITSSHSNARKAASAMIAKIPFELARHIARTYRHP